MEDLNDQVLDGTLTFAQFNQLASELQAVMESYGGVLSGANLEQLFEATKIIAGASNYYTATGTDTITLTRVAAQGLPALLGYEDGYEIRFRPANDNTGAVTVAVDGLAAVDLVDEAGVALVAGDLVTTQDAHARYDTASGDFFLQNATEASIVNEELLATITPSGSSSDTMVLTSTGGFDEYRVEFRDITVNTANANFEFRLATDGVPTILSGASDYSVVILQQSTGGNQNQTGSANAGAIARLLEDVDVDTDSYFSGDMQIFSPGDGTRAFSCIIEGGGWRGSAYKVDGSVSLDPGTSVVRATHIQFLPDAGTYSGTIRLYGIRR